MKIKEVQCLFNSVKIFDKTDTSHFAPAKTGKAETIVKIVTGARKKIYVCSGRSPGMPGHGPDAAVLTAIDESLADIKDKYP